MKEVYVAKTPKEKAMQRALLQYYNPANKEIILEALKKCGRFDLIGNGEKCLVTAPEIKRKNSNIRNSHKGVKPYGKKKKR